MRQVVAGVKADAGTAATVFQPQPLQQLLGAKQPLFPLKTSIDGGNFNVLLGG